MAATKLGTTDITLPQVAVDTVAVGTFNAANLVFVDAPDGDLSKTVFGTIAASEAEAPVFLVNLGRTVPTTPAATGSVNTTGEKRGWKKVKVWVEAGGYKLQAAELDATTVETVTITKDPAYNDVFYSLVNKAVVKVEPEKDKWDMVFTTFTNEVFQNGASAGSYFFSDYVVLNRKNGVTAVKIEGDAAAYEAFTLENYNNGGYTIIPDQRAIGEGWRDVFAKVAFGDVFFVVKDAQGNLYKVKFISMLNEAGERGFPVFQYALLK
jgi:hypothetical protein